MAPPPRNPRPHFLLPDAVTTTTPYQAPNSQRRNAGVPERERPTQARRLRAGLAEAQVELDRAMAAQVEAGWEDGFGLTVRFASFPGVELAVDSLDQRSQGIELLSVAQDGDVTIAKVWVPTGKLDVFERKVAAYLDGRVDSNGRPRDSRTFVDAIQEIRSAVLDDLWVSDSQRPGDDEERAFEAWIATPEQLVGARPRRVLQSTPAEVRIERFVQVATMSGITVARDALRFPEHAVLYLRGTLRQLRTSSRALGQLAELRLAPTTPAFFEGLPPVEQPEWAQELLGRSRFPAPGDDIPYVCILDTGCNPGNPLLAPALDPADMHTVDPSWGINDAHGHGTEQAGLSVWGDLSGVLSSNEHFAISHRLESVKLLPANNANHDRHAGALTRSAVSLPEIVAPQRRRVFAMAVSSEPDLRGRPTAWSAEVDALASDWAGDGESPRLLVLAAGNVTPQRTQYPQLNSATSIEDPAQAWNALTVGALTHKVVIDGEGMGDYRPVAQSGALSPHSATSCGWQRDAPFKPDIVFEGGNVGDDGIIVSPLDSLSLLTTHRGPARIFSTSWATSAAAALASRFTARVMARYPSYWPETIRGLAVHNADWTEAMWQQFGASGRKEDVERLLRHCGWGEPDEAHALSSGSDSLTLVRQGRLQPFQRKERERGEGGRNIGGNVAARDMHLHALPWPKGALEALGNLNVELRVTLSYFIEPSPGERGRSSRFAYGSHGLRFEMQRPLETVAQFQRRINLLARDNDVEIDRAAGADQRWLLGLRRRFRGSLHHDRWSGPAVDLASREHIAVYPKSGWWKTRERQGRFDREARYALIISIRAPGVDVDVDIYAAVEQALTAMAVPIVNDAD
jgi:hypothetical protein